MAKIVRGRKGAAATVTIILVTVLVGLCVLYVLNPTPLNDGVKRAMEKFAPQEAELVLAYSNGCPHCVTFHPVFDQAVESCRSRGINVRVKKLEASKARDEIVKLKVTAFPTTIVLVEGVERTRKVGAVPGEAIVAMVA